LFRTYPPDPLPLLREGGSLEREGLCPSLKALPMFLLRGSGHKESSTLEPVSESHFIRNIVSDLEELTK